MKQATFLAVLYAAASASALMFAVGPQAVYGQQSNQQPSSNSSDQSDQQPTKGLQEIVVTGTRITGGGYQSPNAVSVVSDVDMETLGVTTVAQMMQQLPNNIGTVTPTTVGDSPFNLGGTIANLRGLNTATGTRTLTLVNSKRFVATNNGGGVDLNVVPSAVVGRIETVTGGASATYGADALAGVVNIILDNDLNGVKINADWGQTSEGDGDKTELSIAAGTDVLQERGHIIVSLEHSNQDPIYDCTTRDFCRKSRGLITGNGSATLACAPGDFLCQFFPPAAPPYSVRNSNVLFPNRAENFITEGDRWSILNTGNVWYDPNGTDQYYTFNDAGTDVVPIWANLTPQEISIIKSGFFAGATATPYGTGDLEYSGVNVMPKTTRDTFYTNFKYDLAGGTQLHATVNLSKVDTYARQNSNRQMSFSANVFADNAFLLQGSPKMQQVLGSRMMDNSGFFGPTPQCTLGGFSNPRPYGAGDIVPGCYKIEKVWDGQLVRDNHQQTDTRRFEIGANGSLIEGGSWTWDTYFTYGRTKNDQTIPDWATQTRWAMATDAVFDSSGNVVCRVNRPGDPSYNQWVQFYLDALGDQTKLDEATNYVDTLRAGCQPVNVFGHAASQASLDYSWPDINMGATMTQKAASITLSGDMFKGIGAGPWRMAGGVDMNQMTTQNTIGGGAVLSSDYLVPFGGDWSGRTTNTAPFVEFELPLLRDKPAARYLSLTLADRVTRNKTERLGDQPIGSTRDVTSWKTSLVWQPIDLMRFRITKSSDVRAPGARELYQSTTATVGNMFGQTVTTVNNPFIPKDENDDDAQTDEYMGVTGGNPALDQEEAINQTFGIVFTPGGRLQGLQASIDYYKTTITGGINQLGQSATLTRCFNDVTLRKMAAGASEYCANIQFGPGNPSQAGSPYQQYTNITQIASSNVNEEPYWSRGIDYSINYFTPLEKGGALSIRLLATRFLEQSVDLGSSGVFFGRTNVSGQSGGNGLGSFFGGAGLNYTPTPSLQGNMWVTYAKNAFSVTTQVQYVGKGALTKQNGWIGPGESGYYLDPATGETMGPFPYDPSLSYTVNDNTIPSWTTVSLHFSYDFTRGPLASSRFDGLTASLHILNIANKMPDVYSGRGPGGVNTVLYSVLGRQIQLGLQMQF